MKWLPFLFSFRGRVSRREYAFRLLLPLTLLLAVLQYFYPWRAKFAVTPAATPGSVVFTLLANVLFIWIFAATGAKRYRDRGRSGWFMLFFLVPGAGGLLWLELCLMKGRSERHPMEIER